MDHGLPSCQVKARICAKYLLKEKPDAGIAIMYQNDDFGKDYLKGLKEGFGAKASAASSATKPIVLAALSTKEAAAAPAPRGLFLVRVPVNWYFCSG